MISLCCYSNLQAEQKEGKPPENPSLQISEKCLALLAYGLLSDDEKDIPFGGACKDAIPDSVVNFLRLQKRVFKHWQKTGDRCDEDYIGWRYKGDLSLLGYLICTRLEITEFSLWPFTVGYIRDKYGTDFSFIWRLRLFGLSTQRYRKGLDFSLDTLLNFTSFNDFATYLDSSIADIPNMRLQTWEYWCKKFEENIREYKKYFSKEELENDFFAQYYESRFYENRCRKYK
jgi:hypothetical protein